MKRAIRGVPLAIWVMLIILGMAAVLLTMAQGNAQARPAAGSAAPSGLRIFATLARDAGYRVTSTRDPQPTLAPNDVPVVIELEREPSMFGGEIEEAKRLEAIGKGLARHLEKGGTVIQSRLRVDFRKTTLEVGDDTSIVSDEEDQVGNVSASATTEFPGGWIGETTGSTGLWWRDDDESFVWIERKGQGRLIILDDAMMATNRFITEHDNAAFLMGMLRGLVPAGSRLVFMESVWGNQREPTLMEQIGPWAAAAWTQLVVLLLVIGYTLGRGFGLPSATRPRQVGQRDLVEATASFYRRAKASDIALTAELADARHKILSELKLPRGTDFSVWSERVPDKLREVYREVEFASKERVRTSDAIRLARVLDHEVTAFVGEKRLATRRRLRNSGTSKRF